MFESLLRTVESRMRKPLDLNDARTFVSAAQAGTLSGAARDLEVPTSTVSRSLTRLEERVGLLLVRRSSQGLVLTDAGKEYLLSCKHALRLLREGDDLLEKHRAEPAGVLTVECPVTMARDILAPLLGRFIAANPKLRVSMDVYSSGYDHEPKENIFTSRFVAPGTRRNAFIATRTPSEDSLRVQAM